MATDRDVLDVQVRVLEEALYSPQFKHNTLARQVFEARLIELRLATLASETPVAPQHTAVARLDAYLQA